MGYSLQTHTTLSSLADNNIARMQLRLSQRSLTAGSAYFYAGTTLLQSLWRGMLSVYSGKTIGYRRVIQHIGNHAILRSIGAARLASSCPSVRCGAPEAPPAAKAADLTAKSPLYNLKATIDNIRRER